MKVILCVSLADSINRSQIENARALWALLRSKSDRVLASVYSRWSQNFLCIVSLSVGIYSAIIFQIFGSFFSIKLRL